eukprot:4434080-Pyramimonas_sp.AAC.1
MLPPIGRMQFLLYGRHHDDMSVSSSPAGGGALLRARRQAYYYYVCGVRWSERAPRDARRGVHSRVTPASRPVCSDLTHRSFELPERAPQHGHRRIDR